MTTPVLTEAERRVMDELRIQVEAYETGTAGNPAPVARWLRILAADLEASDAS